METQKTSSSQGNLEIKEQWEWGGCWIDWEFGVSRCKLLHLEEVSIEILLYSIGN